MTPAQSRAARALLDWGQEQLASAAEVSSVTVRNFENEKAAPQRATLSAMRRALETAGVIFVEENGEGPGVRLAKSRRLVSGGANGYRYQGGVEFGMTDGAKVIRCQISDEALKDLDRIAPSDYVAAFERHRSTIEAVADALYRRRGTDQDGIVLVISSDIQAFRG